MTNATEKENIKMKSEERRALVLLGTAAIVASFLAPMLADVWSGTKKVEDFYFNLPPVNSPIPHATYYWIYILGFALASWLLYAFFAFWYFSADWLSPKTRDMFHFAATVFMGFYILYITAYIPLVYFDVIWVKDPAQQVIFYLLILVFILILEFEFIEWAMGVGGLIPRALRRMRKRRKSVIQQFPI